MNAAQKKRVLFFGQCGQSIKINLTIHFRGRDDASVSETKRCVQAIA